MTRRKPLSRTQLAVINDIFAGELDEQAILQKHNVSKWAFDRWLREGLFIVELNRRVEWLSLQSELIIARYKTLAAARLVQLTESEKEETARKACLDIISLPRHAANSSQRSAAQPQTSGGQQEQQLSPEIASRLLAALAEERQQETARYMPCEK